MLFVINDYAGVLFVMYMVIGAINKASLTGAQPQQFRQIQLLHNTPKGVSARPLTQKLSKHLYSNIYFLYYGFELTINEMPLHFLKLVIRCCFRYRCTSAGWKIWWGKCSNRSAKVRKQTANRCTADSAANQTAAGSTSSNHNHTWQFRLFLRNL